MLTHWLMYISTIVGSCHKPEQTTRHMFEIRTLVADISDKKKITIFIIIIFIIVECIWPRALLAFGFIKHLAIKANNWSKLYDCCEGLKGFVRNQFPR